MYPACIGGDMYSIIMTITIDVTDIKGFHYYNNNCLWYFCFSSRVETWKMAIDCQTESMELCVAARIWWFAVLTTKLVV